MPVWHCSIARISDDRTRIVPPNKWSRVTKEAARKVVADFINGVGGTWEREEQGDLALHTRRRLNQAEIDLLWKVNESCPVFTRGAAKRSGL